MIRISVWHRDLSESYLRQITQLGADCLDFGSGDAFPGVAEQGYPDLDALLKIKRKIRSLVVDKAEFKRLRKQLDIEHALPIWGNQSATSS